jgi:hypothetical protein
MCLAGRGLELGHPVVSTDLVLSLSANHMPCMGRARIVLDTRFIWNFSFWPIDNNVFVY